MRGRVTSRASQQHGYVASSTIDGLILHAPRIVECSQPTIATVTSTQSPSSVMVPRDIHRPRLVSTTSGILTLFRAGLPMYMNAGAHLSLLHQCSAICRRRALHVYSMEALRECGCASL